MNDDFDDLRRCVEGMVESEVEHLRRVLELRLTTLVREVLAERLMPCKRSGNANRRLGHLRPFHPEAPSLPRRTPQSH